MTILSGAVGRSQVHEALLSQKKVWKVLIDELTKNRMSQSLPPRPPQRVLLFGVGSSFFAAKLTGFFLQRHSQFQVGAFSSQSIGIEMTPRKGDWAFAFSHRGKTPATLEALEWCSRAGAFTVLVASSEAEEPSSARMKLATCPLEKCEPHTMAVTSAICAVTTLLTGHLAVEPWGKLIQEPDPDLEKMKEKVGSGPGLILGEWEGEWVAREIGLKLIEMAGLKVNVYGTEEFFHGPQTLLKNNSEKIWTVALPGDRRQEGLKADYRIQVKNRPEGWMSALVELQWASLAVALNRGKNPDNPI